MAFGKLVIKARVKRGRGSTDAEAIEEAIKDCWDDVQTALESLSPEEAQELKDHFNTLLGEDFEDLGTILFGDVSGFEEKMATMDTEDKDKYFQEMFKTEFLDEAHLKGEDD